MKFDAMCFSELSKRSLACSVWPRRCASQALLRSGDQCLGGVYLKRFAMRGSLLTNGLSFRVSARPLNTKNGLMPASLAAMLANLLVHDMRITHANRARSSSIFFCRVSGIPPMATWGVRERRNTTKEYADGEPGTAL